MGEIADMLINGDLDYYTGEYMGRGKGYPRTMDGSLPWERKKKSNPTFGVLNYMVKKGIDNPDDVLKILQKYAEFKKWEIAEKKFVDAISVKIQQDFGSFCGWLGNNRQLLLKKA